MKYIHLILFWAIIVHISNAQDPHFSQFNASGTYLNPANTGLMHDLQATTIYRNQYSSVSTPYQTSLVSFDMVTSNDRTKNATLGVGAQFIYDKAGDSQFKQMGGALNLSGILNLNNESKLSCGIMAGFGQRGIEPSSLRWENQYMSGAYNGQLSSNEYFTSTNFSYIDAGAGIAYAFGKGQSYITANDGVKGSFGISAFHFGIPAHSFYGSNEKLKTKLSLQSSVEFGQRNSHLTIITSCYVSIQGNQKDILFGNTFRYLLKEGSHFTGFVSSSSISLGTHYRWNDAFIGTFQIDYANYSVGMAYDFNVSKLNSFSRGRGAFEIFLRFVTPNPFNKTFTSRIR